MLRSWIKSRDAAGTHVFARWTLSAIAILVTATYCVSAALLFHVARQEDIRSERRTELQLRANIAVEEEQLMRALASLLANGILYHNLHPTLNLEWAYERGVLGPRLHHLLGMDWVYVISAQNSVVYELRQGRLQDPDDGSHLPTGLGALLADARRTGVHGLFWIGGRPALVGAQPITPPPNAADPTPAGPTSILVFGRLLENEVLSRIARRTDLPDLRLGAGGGAKLELASRAGDPVVLSWTSPAPGATVTRAVMPWLLACGGTLVLFTWLILARASASARQMEAASRVMQESRAALQLSEARFRDVAEAATDWIWETDAALRITYLSERYEALTGRSGAELMGQPLDTVLHSIEGPLESWTARAAERRVTPLSCRYLASDGTLRLCRVAAKAVCDADGHLSGFRGTASDITAEVEAHRKMEHLALYDPLTSLPNRTLFMEFLSGALSSIGDSQRLVAALRIGLANTRQITESYGLAAGDAVLAECALRLKQVITDSDLVARLGAEDFALVATAPGNGLAVKDLCARVQAALNAPVRLPEGDLIDLSCAIGVALAPNDCMEGELLLRSAEFALQHAQGEEPPGIAFFSADMTEQVQAKRTLEHDLRRTVGSEDFVVLYQPRFSAATQEPVAVEALVRWLHPGFGLLSPDRFIPLAEASGLIVPLGEWVLRRACATIAKWPDLVVSVNVSPVQFRQGEQLLETVRAALKDSGLPPERLELEITENVLLENTEKALDVLVGIKTLGVRLAMDDFGTGYSSLNYLRNFPFDRIKIDRRFVGDLEQSRDAQGIVEAIIGLGRALNLQVTAEGVETAGQFAWLRKAGCEELQGFHFARPMSEADLIALKPRTRAG